MFVIIFFLASRRLVVDCFRGPFLGETLIMIRPCSLWYDCIYWSRFETLSSYLGVAQIEKWKRLVLTQMCNRHAICANMNKASKQANRIKCLPGERLVQGKRHVGNKALLAHGTLSHFYDLKSKSESSVFLPHRNLKV